MPWCYWSNCWNPWNRFSVRVIGSCFRLWGNLFLLHWRWRATHHTPLQEFTRRLQFLILCLWLVGTWYQWSKDLGNWESMRPIFDGVLELYNGSLAHSATFWLSSDCLGSKPVICASRAEPRWQQSDELGLVQWCTGHAHRLGYNLVFSHANDNETKYLQHVMATPLVNLEAHLLRLHRIIRLTRGMALLIGVGGSGIVAAMRISRPFAFDAAFWDWSNVHSVSQLLNTVVCILKNKYSCLQLTHRHTHAYIQAERMDTDAHKHTRRHEHMYCAHAHCLYAYFCMHLGRDG